MKLYGGPLRFYREHVRKRVPDPLRAAIPASARQRVLHVGRRVAAELDHWRVSKPITSLLGPQYRRSRRYIEIDITYACNLNCLHCNRSCEQAPTGEHLSLGQLDAFLAETIARGIRWERIRLVGGEPTLHHDFADIVERLRAWRSSHSPTTRIEVTTNGYGDRVRKRIDALPLDVVVNDTGKTTPHQPEFESFNLAPTDLSEYASADYRNGCWIIDGCGIGLGPSGYYPCAIAGGIDRILGDDLGRQALPSDDDDMEDLLEHFCRTCGHFKRRLEGPVQGTGKSPTWERAYARWREARPRLSRYASPRAERPTPGHHQP